MKQSLSEYQQFMDLLGPIQKLAEHRHIAIVLIDHMRKASAEDDFDTIMGSQGKGGSADNILIYHPQRRRKRWGTQGPVVVILKKNSSC